MKNKVVIAFFFLAATFVAAGQETVRIMHYNLLNYGNYTSYCTSSNNFVDDKDNYLRTIIGHTLPDIFTVNEIDVLPYYHNRILDEVMNADARNYYARASSTNYANSYTMNMLYYDTRKFVLKEESVVQTYLRDINAYKLFYKDPNLAVHNDTAFLLCFSAHLKAGSSGSDEQERALMTGNLMSYLDDIGVSDNYVLMGDFNVYSSNEQAFQNLINHTNSNIRFYDPINKMGDWNNNPYYADCHTQSTHVISNDCAAPGGMDDRFDFILLSSKVMNGIDHYSYVQNSYQALGQDGNRFNSSIIDPANTSVPYNVANALYGMSDHLPVLLELEVDPAPNGIGNSLVSYKVNFMVSNPFQGNIALNAESNASMPCCVTIYNSVGAKVYSKEVDILKGTSKFIIEAEELKKGLYILSLDYGGRNTSMKLVKY